MRHVLSLVLLIAVNAVFAQPKLLENFQGPPGTQTLGSRPEKLVELDGKVYFYATDLAHGKSIWQSDGTETGTQLVVAPIPDAQYSVVSELTRFKDYLLFNMRGEGAGIWKTDGTESGTSRIFEQEYLQQSSFPGDGPFQFMPGDDLFYFIGYDPDHGYELWKSDGTHDGTSLVKDIYPGTSNSIVTTFSQVLWAILDDTLYFVATDGTHGYELWKSDGTTAGTQMVKDIVSGNNDDWTNWYTSGGPKIVDNTVYFVKNAQIWTTDGTDGGTVQVTNYNPVANEPKVSSIRGAIGNKVIFTAVGNKRVYATDGTGFEVLSASSPHQIGDYKNFFFFKEDLYIATEEPDHIELWKYDGTSLTLAVDDLDGTMLRRITTTNDHIFIRTYVDINEDILWRTDGTTEGTSMVTTLDNNGVGEFLGVGEQLFFVNSDPEFSELWVSDGTESGTHITKDINIKTNTDPWFLLKMGEEIFFKGWDPDHGFELWKTDGTEEGTVMVKDLTPGPAGSDILLYNIVDNHLMFRVQNSPPERRDILWKTDGSEAGTTIVMEPQSYGQFHDIALVGNKLLLTVEFSNNNSDNGMWITDGTTTTRIGDVPSGMTSWTTVGDKVFYGRNNRELWVTDGTSIGSLVMDLGAGVKPIEFFSANNLLYFYAHDEQYSHELWMSDGTAEGTRKVKHIREDNESSYSYYPFFLGKDGDKVYFATAVSGHDIEPWVTDGTEEGTHLLKDINEGPEGSHPSYFVFKEHGAYFSASMSDEIGGELWKTDGTSEGTVFVKDIFEGPRSSLVNALANSGGYSNTYSRANTIGPNDNEFYLMAKDEMHGGELWITDGTTEKTRLVWDMTPGPGSSQIYFVERMDDRFLFLCDDGVGHNGIWYIDIRDHWINFDPIEDKVATETPFDLVASSSAVLPVTFTVVSGPAAIVNNKLTMTGAGEIVVRADAAGNDDYDDAKPVEQMFNVSKASQSLTFDQLPDRAFSDEPFSINATATSDLPVTFTVISGPATVNGNMVTLSGVGSATIKAEQTGNDIYLAAQAVEQTFTVNKISQEITFNQISDKKVNDEPFSINAMATSDLPVTFTVISGPATVNGNMVTLSGVGSVTIKAEQAGNDIYLAAQAVEQTFMINKISQEITFNQISDRKVNDEPFSINAMATSDLPVTFTVISGPATINGNMVTLSGAGSVTIKAEQAGNDIYFAAQSVEQTFTVSKISQEITFNQISDKKVNDEPFSINAMATSDLPVTFTVISGPATVNGNMVTLSGAGSVTIKAEQAGNDIYLAADPVQQSFTVNKISQLITFNELADRKSDDAPFTISATASSNLPVTFSVVSGPAAISGNAVTLSGGGTVTIKAEQPGNNIYLAAEAVQRSFDVELVVGLNELDQRISVYPNPVSDRLYIQSQATIVQSVSLIDALGRSVLNATVDGSSGSVSLADLPQGVYVLRLMSSSETFTAHIHIKR